MRTAGLQGRVSVDWEISPADESVFLTTSDTVSFEDGENLVTVEIQVQCSNSVLLRYLCGTLHEVPNYTPLQSMCLLEACTYYASLVLNVYDLFCKA